MSISRITAKAGCAVSSRKCSVSHTGRIKYRHNRPATGITNSNEATILDVSLALLRHHSQNTLLQGEHFRWLHLQTYRPSSWPIKRRPSATVPSGTTLPTPFGTSPKGP